jgi:integrase
VTKGRKLTKRMCDTAVEVTPPGRERVLWDAGDGSVKGFGLRVSAKGARSFILMYRAGKGRTAPLRKVTIGPFGSPWTVDMARTEARRTLGEVAAGKDPAGDRAKQRVVAKGEVEAQDSVRAAVEDWLRRDQADNRTVGEVRRVMQREVLPTWGDRSLADIRKRHVIELIDGIADRGAKTAANRALAYVHRFFNWCVKRDRIELNPAHLVEKSTAEVSRNRVLDDAELVEVWRAVEGMVQPFAAGVRLLILTGARRSEIFEAGKAELVPGAIVLPAARSKTAEGRLIHLSPLAGEIVDGLSVWATCQYLLTTDGRHAYGGFGKAKAELDRRILAGRQGVAGDDAEPMKPWRLHDLRRSVATGLQRLGVRLEAIEAVLGHVSGSRAGIVGVYQRHQFTAEAGAALDLWGEHVMRLLDPAPAQVLPMRQRAKA